MLGKQSETLDVKEVEHFGKILMNNEFYELFMYDFLDIHLFDETLKPDEFITINFEKEFGRPFDGCLDDLKKFAKKRILSMLFAKPSHYIHEQAIFQKYFPKIHFFIKKYKRRYCKELKSKGQHKKLSYLGFQIESDFMLNHIARDFNNQYKRKKIIFTLHDCIITKKEDVVLLREFMYEKFNELIGYSPNLKLEYWEDNPNSLQEMLLLKSA
jgi:hypothetical protein